MCAIYIDNYHDYEYQPYVHVWHNIIYNLILEWTWTCWNVYKIGKQAVDKWDFSLNIQSVTEYPIRPWPLLHVEVVFTTYFTDVEEFLLELSSDLPMLTSA